jgi:hypothetical protein
MPCRGWSPDSFVRTPRTSSSIVAHLKENVAAAEIAVSKDDFEGLSRVLHGASQTVHEQSGELCRILGCAAFGEKGCAVKQFGGFGERGIVPAALDEAQVSRHELVAVAHR